MSPWKPLWQRWPLRRRWTVAVVLSVIVGVAAYGVRDVPQLRWLRSRSLAAAYSAVDRFLPSSEVNFGPPPANPPMLPSTLTRQLQKAMAGRILDVSVMPPTRLCEPEAIFQHEDLQHPRVREFAQSADDLLAGTPDVFELSNRVRALTHHGEEPLPATATDPQNYLELARSGKKLTCRYFAVIYGAVAVARGYTSRLIGLSRTGNLFEHAVVEVYVPEFGKWVLVDPDFNVAYRKDGVWLDAWQLHALWREVQQQADTSEGSDPPTGAARDTLRRAASDLGVEMVVLGEAGERLRQSNLYDSSLTGVNLEYFAYVFYHTGNDFLSGWYPPGHPGRSLQFVLKSPLAPAPAVCPEGYPAGSRASLYWPVARTAISQLATDETNPSSIHVQLGTWTPNFAGFQVRIDRGDWTPIQGNRLRWKVGPGENLLEARSINAGGLPGETVTCRLALAGSTN